MEGYTEVVKALLKAGAEVNVKVSRNDKVQTPLVIASRLGYSEIVELLKEHGAK